MHRVAGAELMEQFIAKHADKIETRYCEWLKQPISSRAQAQRSSRDATGPPCQHNSVLSNQRARSARSVEARGIAGSFARNGASPSCRSQSASGSLVSALPGRLSPALVD